MALMFPVFMGMASKLDIASFVETQLSNYNYTFPKAPRVRFFFSREHVLTPIQGIGHGNLVMSSKPYRNDWISSVIRDQYFSGGQPFSTRYNYLFRDTEDDNTVHKVPIPMVALVATAVRPFYHMCK